MEVVTACCKDIMIIVNKYAGDISAIVVGIETNLSTMVWSHSVNMVTEQQSWLKHKLINIENVLMKLLEGRYKQEYIIK